MESFPCLLERKVASALLLLSGNPPSVSPPLSDPDSDESQKSLWLSNLASCSSFFLENTGDRHFSGKSLAMTNSKLYSYVFQDNGSEKVGRLSNSKSSSCLSIEHVVSKKNVGLCNSKSSSCLTNLENASEKSVGLSNSKSSSLLSSLTIDDGSSAETRAHRLRMVVDAARSHERKLKVVRKSRTQMMRKSHQQKKIFNVKVSTKGSTSNIDEASSCLSSGSSGGTEVVSKPKLKSPLSSASIRSRAEGIMRVLSYGCVSEVRIRQLLGDSPDTSKALRLLLKKEQIRRSGNGGRGHPYIYEIA